jgi:hypothetical protein
LFVTECKSNVNSPELPGVARQDEDGRRSFSFDCADIFGEKSEAASGPVRPEGTHDKDLRGAASF